MLVATSLAPVLGAFGMISYSKGEPTWAALQWFICAALLLLICWLVLYFAKNQIEKEVLTINSVKNADKEVLTFLLVYLLPLVARDSPPMAKTEVTVYVFFMIAWAVYHSNAFYFNPLLGLLGYHFYEITSADGMSHTLITTKTVRKAPVDLEVVQLFDYTYLAADKEGKA
jgi:MFS family permease